VHARGPQIVNTIRYQFSIRRLLILTSVVAVVMAVSIRLGASQVMQGLFAAYFVFLAGWAVMRGPNVYANLVAARRRRSKLKERRLALESQALDRGRTGEIAKAGDDSDGC